MKEVTVVELKKMMDNSEGFQLIDVREEHEAEIATIGGELIPMGNIMDNLDKISKEKKVVVYCRSGNRSGVIVQTLEGQGFSNVYNMKGGITAWAKEIEPTMPTY
jgi:sulfur-carrier protein adenylyltransferase/sulfurtransferase